MRSNLTFIALLLLCACTKGSKPASPVSRGGETDIVRTCEAMQHKVEGLYQKATDHEDVAPNLRSEFVTANVNMVLSDCRLSPAVSYDCLQQARDVKQVESCMVFLDDEGTVEGFRFANGGS